MIGLPDHISACLFDLDGVLTSTARLHREAWKETFDAFLADREDPRFRPFTDADYAAHVDGRPRADGVREFLLSRGITLPEGEPDDPPTAATVNGVGNRKNDLVQRILAERGVESYPGSVRYLEAARAAGLAIGVVTSSANGGPVLEAAGLSGFVQARVDGLVIRREGLRGKPAPDSFLAGARALGVAPEHAAVFEDAQAGVEAGRAGGFGFVVGVNRADQAEALRARGADVVVNDLAELLEEG
ncbi:haloacid dehalogenase superfamily, subfamily IA, variant 3 with third motif having DD or ED/beta-phosphoglucomutase family hydrolase [Amycolatopsis arida]|uniref:Beta-phosphoglucomutase n=1 Tax=Amycolatopsis arida TaxID=587909 RepID=A0A1I5XIQ2_9PSEU|nr:beta-phosphoglucomutase family hydrolase [Amycolatopsis arida]TDX97440.1 HAD superfamily hydrolase (TIGR01509 family)/beta-phosphoglucomutase family hydrolase [Amycolatopsis arida]SFQ31537.1 haloacid dehalogenase superfamily, subfamily IA, variant 3 with third motif having DD or ED/beta-phosphoglucomutase family hydrolase [Amycolatopsis arida]